jgi:ribonucleases P/MRP protein subunit RPP40
MSYRYQAVTVAGTISSWSEVKSGVPQGSVLGPLLFAAIVDALHPVSEISILVKYADDLTILHFIRSRREDNLQAEWYHIKSW